jgi:hypothetical protein
MAKQKPDLSGVFTKTETEQPKKDKIKPVGIGLKISEWERIEEIGAELGVNRHMLAAWILRDFIERYEAGYKPPTKTKTKTILK